MILAVFSCAALLAGHCAAAESSLTRLLNGDGNRDLVRCRDRDCPGGAAAIPGLPSASPGGASTPPPSDLSDTPIDAPPTAAPTAVSCTPATSVLLSTL
jgi:hypothetical protein